MKNFEKNPQNNEIKTPPLDKAAVSSLKRADRALNPEATYQALSVAELHLGTNDATLEIKKNAIGGLSATVKDKHYQIILETSDLKEIEDLKKAADHKTVTEEVALEESDEDIEEE